MAKSKLTPISAEKREVLGRKVKTLRAEGKIPANIFGSGVKSASITIDQKEFDNVYGEVGETGIVEIALGKIKKPALVANLQVDPVTDAPLHVDFRQVDLKKKVTAQVPIHLEGESPAAKAGLIIGQQLQEIEVEALPLDLPESFEVDSSSLVDLESVITVKDLAVDKKTVKVLAEDDQIIANVSEPREEEEIVPETTDEEAEEGAETPEGEEAAEGEKEETKKEEAEESEEE